MPMNFIVNQMGNPRARRSAPREPSEPKNKRESLISMPNLISLYQSGATWEQLEEATGYGHKEIRKWLKREGAYKPRKYLTNAQLRKALVMRSGGCTWPEIGKKLGYTHGGIQRALKNKGMM